MTPKQAARLSDEELEVAIADADSEIGSRGERIAALRAEQREHLKTKDMLVLEQTNRIRAAGAQNLGPTDG